MGNACCKNGGCCCCCRTGGDSELPTYKETKQTLFFKKYPKIEATFRKLKDEIPKNWNIKRQLETKIEGQGIFLGKKDVKIRTGYGVMLYDVGLYYIGVFTDNNRSGMGFMIDPNGSYYKGQWRDDMPNGYGQYQDGIHNWVYKGKWSDGKKNQMGQQIYPDGTVYVGSYKNNKKNGMGKFFFDKGCYFKGSFDDDIANGKNCVQKGQDYIYSGPFENNDMHGAGKVAYFNNRGQTIEYYIGQFYKGVKHGYGEYTWADGSAYKGQWVNGQLANKGVFIEG